MNFSRESRTGGLAGPLRRSVLLFLAAGLTMPGLKATPADADGRDAIVAEAKLRESLPLPLIPLPREVAVLPGATRFQGPKIELPEGDADPRFKTIFAALTEAFGESRAATGTIRFAIDPKASENPEGYSLVIDASGATVKAPGAAGLFYGATTLMQLRGLAKSPDLPRLEIRDAPDLPYRSVMHDLGRSYMTIDRLKRHLDTFAAYKLNIFHWHLTENPAWRFEVKSHPELTRAEFHDKERAPGKCYTQAEIRDVIAYAKARNITVVPEIDIPGHTAALRRALGVKRMDDPKVAVVLRDVFRELLALAPPEDTPFIHMGSDEAHGSHEKMPDAFVAEIAGMIRASGRRAILWSPGMKPPTDDDKSLQMLWASGKPNKANPYIDARSLYANLNTGFDGVRTTYWNAPARDGYGKRFGASLALWLDLPTLDQNIERVSPFWPAVITLADRAWHGGTFREDLLVSLPAEGTPEARAAGDFDAAVVAHRDVFFKDVIFPYVRDDGFWRLLGPVPNAGKRDAVFGPEKDFSNVSPAPVKVGETTYAWDKSARGAQVFVRHMFGWKGALDDDAPKTLPWVGGREKNRPDPKDTTVYARAVIESDADREVGFWIQIDPPNASDRRAGPNPARGQWNRGGARVWINGTEIAPPEWKTPGQGAAKDTVALTDEFYYLRPAIRVKLRKGDNVVLLRLPSGGPKSEFVCTPVAWDGVNAREIPGVRFKKF